MQAALTACPQADVVVVAHTGLDELDSVADIWAAVPVDNTLVMSWTAFGAEAVPRATADLTDWLGYQWQLMDIWVAETSEAVAAGSAPGSADSCRSGPRARRLRTSRLRPAGLRSSCRPKVSSTRIHSRAAASPSCRRRG